VPVSTSAGTSYNGLSSFDDYNSATASNKGTVPITAITFGYNAWTTGLQVKYGTTVTPWRGGTGYYSLQTLTMAEGECVTQGTVKTTSGGTPYSVTLVTSGGQSVTWGNYGWSNPVTVDVTPPSVSGRAPLCLLAINPDVQQTGYTFNSAPTPVIQRLRFLWGECGSANLQALAFFSSLL
jgi:hypothetical protein